ncbi:hypothetical protein EJ04DRAFT_514911 [Polyplosphaeria fusca]|uniref:Uncharacterized protein n=1 Tax=Polyplosphaeria fusca TaxID=682080 RepID=A0A9P4QR16_9PLEO|nr:hypothetical protein EJ04DRAFT_514911 [Polyplosphaeria fusca]
MASHNSQDSFPTYTDQPSAPSNHSWSSHQRKASGEHNAAMRDIIREWMGPAPTSYAPGSRTIMASSWSKFSSSSRPKLDDEMRASVLWAPRGTAPNFCPPPSEWAYLGVDQGLPVGKPQATGDGRRRKPASDASWTTESPSSSTESASNGVAFKKEVLKGPVTTSLLTASFKSQQSHGSAMESLRKELAKRSLEGDRIPSAFDDSDSESDEDD